MSNAKTSLERFRSAVEKGLTNENRDELIAIEKRIKTLEDYSNLANHIGIQDLLRWIKSNITEINEQLMTDRKMLYAGREAERLALIDKKDMFIYFASLFDPSLELENLDKYLQEQSEVFESYNAPR